MAFHFKTKEALHNYSHLNLHTYFILWLARMGKVRYRILDYSKEDLPTILIRECRAEIQTWDLPCGKRLQHPEGVHVHRQNSL